MKASKHTKYWKFIRTFLLMFWLNC